MSLNQEYKRKIEYYLEIFPQYFTTETLNFGFSGFVTKDRLTLEEAQKMPREVFQEGKEWGYCWEYAWLFGSMTIPKECEGKRIVISSDNGEGVVWVNGKIMGSIDREHKHMTLTTCAVPGETYDIVMEVYAGHGRKGLAHDHFTGPINERTKNQFEIFEGKQKVIKNARLSIWHEDIYQSYMDFRTLFELRNCLPPETQRVADIDSALKKAVNIVDFELPFEQMCETVTSAARLLRPALDAKNGTSAATMYAFGHSHLDLEWLWTDAETRRKIARTVGNQLQMIKEYPEYKYLQSQPWLIDVLKNEYPELYEEFKAAVKAGNIIVDGAMWVEPDLNVPSGESLIRQHMYGKKFIMDEFGIDSRMVWVPDVFGCGCSLPQIVKGCDCDYFFNAKLPWTYNGGTPFPRSTFIWRGIDGTEVLTHMIAGYGAPCNPKTVKSQRDQYMTKEETRLQAYAFGWSDGGGGAEREHMEFFRRETDLEGLPKMKMSSPAEIFETLGGCNVTSIYDGELYYCAHRGTYTSQAKTKLLNRRSEFALRDAEMASAVFGGDDREAYEKLWKTVLFNQFHDILPGSSISEVYVQAERELADVVATAEDRTEKALSSALTSDSKSLTVFNTLSWNRKAEVVLPEGATGAVDADGRTLESQKCEDGVHVLVDVPSCGTATVTLNNNNVPTDSAADGLTLENDLVAITFDRSGEITSIIDKESGCEYLTGKANRFVMYADMPLYCDAWDIDSYYEELKVDIPDITAVSEVTRGPLFSSLKIKKTLGDSILTQTVILRKGKKQADFVTTVDWKETHKLLKVFFDTNINTSEITSEMQFGYIERPAHRSDNYSKERFEVCQHKWSALCENKRIFAVLNDCKYGVGAVNGSMGVTLLKSATDPDFTADKGIQNFTYSIYLSNDITETVKAAWELNVPVVTASGKCDARSYFTVSADNIIIDTVKLAEDGSGDVIVRLYECSNTMTKCSLKTILPVKAVSITNMLEKPISDAPFGDDGVALTFRGFEVVTVRLSK